MPQDKAQRQGDGDGDGDEENADPAGQQRREKLGEGVDEILDDIDDVLEDNAHEFVRTYIQKGGE